MADSITSGNAYTVGNAAGVGAAPPSWWTHAVPTVSLMPAPPAGSSEHLEAMIKSRLRLNSYERLPFDSLHAVKVNQELVATLVVQNGQWTVIEDSFELFPSDQFVVSLRLLMR